MSDQPTDLRDQIAKAVAVEILRGVTSYDATAVHTQAARLADAVIAVVQPALDRQAAEIVRLNQAVDYAKGSIKDWARDNELVRRERIDQQQRAEQAEAELAKLRAETAPLRERRQQIGP